MTAAVADGALASTVGAAGAATGFACRYCSFQYITRARSRSASAPLSLREVSGSSLAIASCGFPAFTSARAPPSTDSIWICGKRPLVDFSTSA